MNKNRFFPVLALCIISALFFNCTGKNKDSQNKKQGVSIAVFIPGVMSGSPIYEMLAQGVQQAALEFAVSNPAPEVKIIEGGINQAEWENQVTLLAASGSFDLIVSSNPSLPTIVSSVSAKFPEQKFLLMDGELAGNPSVYTLRYNQREQAYMAGHIAALAALETGGRKRIGLVAAQEYPVMMNTILPGYLEGACAVDSGFTVDFRVVGNWFDANKAAELAAELIRAGSSVLLPIAGGAGEGAVQAAAEAGAKLVWFDTNGYGIRPGTVVGSTVIRQDKAAYEKTLLFLGGELPFGTADLAGIAGSYVDFVEDDPLYIYYVSPAVREKQAAMTARLRSGELRLDN
ncbi:MAG: BMP family ABC transporter substrate-binding protein [Treponema sp.]|jgi:simple sugar transport system substrate-binding protein|nr:BMP family ABC transporter substrate-binding protein [Treponema sp.]